MIFQTSDGKVWSSTHNYPHVFKMTDVAHVSAFLALVISNNVLWSWLLLLYSKNVQLQIRIYIYTQCVYIYIYRYYYIYIAVYIYIHNNKAVNKLRIGFSPFAKGHTSNFKPPFVGTGHEWPAQVARAGGPFCRSMWVSLYRWMVRENPSIEWMMTRGTPMT